MKNEKLFFLIIGTIFLLLYIVGKFQIISVELRAALTLFAGGILIYRLYQQETTRIVSIVLLVVFVLFVFFYLSI